MQSTAHFSQGAVLALAEHVGVAVACIVPNRGMSTNRNTSHVCGRVADTRWVDLSTEPLDTAGRMLVEQRIPVILDVNGVGEVARPLQPDAGRVYHWAADSVAGDRTHGRVDYRKHKGISVDHGDEFCTVPALRSHDVPARLLVSSIRRSGAVLADDLPRQRPLGSPGLCPTQADE